MSSKNTARKYCGQKMVTRVGKLTGDAFEATILEAVSIFSIPAEDVPLFKLELRRFGRFGYLLSHGEPPFNIEIITQAKEYVDEKYLEKLCAMTTKQIEDILWCHEKRKILRADRTVEMLTNELTRRAIFSDSSESETRSSRVGSCKSKRKVKDG